MTNLPLLNHPLDERARLTTICRRASGSMPRLAVPTARRPSSVPWGSRSHEASSFALAAVRGGSFGPAGLKTCAASK